MLISDQVKTGQCENLLKLIIDQGLFSQKIRWLSKAEDHANGGINPQFGHKLDQLSSKIKVV